MTEIKEKKVEDIRQEAEAKGCPVQKAYYYMGEFLAGPMCGKCFPCAMGAYEAKLRLANLVEGRGTEEDIRKLRLIAEEMQFASFCKKGKDTAKFITEWMGTGVYERHVQGVCPSKECKGLIAYRIIPEKCTNCGLCADACRHSAIIGEKRAGFRSGYIPFEIRQARCQKAGDCYRVCPEGAVEIIDRAAVLEVKA
jgi:ferredoxin